MAKILHDLNYRVNGELLVVDGNDWGDTGLSLQQLIQLQRLSEKRGGFEFVLTDQPIPAPVWTDRRNLHMWEVRWEFLQQALYTHQWRGGCCDPANVLKLSQLFGTDIAYTNSWPKDLDENSLVFWWMHPPKESPIVCLMFEHDLR